MSALIFAFAARHDLANVFFGGPIFGGKFTLKDSASGIAGANFRNLSIGQSCLAMGIAMRMSTLAYHVIMVVLISAKKQMGRVHATRIVARMANQLAVWQCAICQLISYAMRLPSLVTTQFDLPVTLSVKRSLPFPTIIGTALVNFLPKAFCDGAVGGGLMAANVLALLAREFMAGYFLTATAFTEDGARGMIAHVASPPETFGQSRGRLQRRSATFICVLQEYFTIGGMEAQRV